MQRAIALAKKGAGFVNPNPMVGCVVVKDNEIITEGYHEYYGGLHAERNALTNCTSDCKDATLYVTLEPCCHYGKTPPCTEIIIEKGIKKVVVGLLDPNPLVSGKGISILQNSGIEVVSGVEEDKIKDLNKVFDVMLEFLDNTGVHPGESIPVWGEPPCKGGCFGFGRRPRHSGVGKSSCRRSLCCKRFVVG